MPLIISKNTMRYDADQAEAQRQYVTSADIGVTDAQPYTFDPPFNFSVDEKCHTCYAELAYTMPGEATGQAGIHFILKGQSAEGWEELPMVGVKNARGGPSGFLAATIGSVEPLTRVHLEIHCLSGSFTIPSGSKFNMSVRANDSALVVHPVTGPAPAAVPPAIAKGFRVPSSYAGIYPDIVGEYRFFPYSFDRLGQDVTHVDSGIYERSEDDGSTVTVYILLHWKNDGWQTMTMYKRQFTGAAYAAAKALHLAGTGHLDYSSRVNFDNLPEWSTPDPVSGHGYWFPFSSYNYPAFADGVGTIPEHTIPSDSTRVDTEIIQ